LHNRDFGKQDNFKRFPTHEKRVSANDQPPVRRCGSGVLFGPIKVSFWPAELEETFSGSIAIGQKASIPAGRSSNVQLNSIRALPW